MSSHATALAVCVALVLTYLDGCHQALRPEHTLPSAKPIHLHVGEPLVFDTVENSRDGWLRVAADAEAEVQKLARR